MSETENSIKRFIDFPSGSEVEIKAKMFHKDDFTQFRDSAGSFLFSMNSIRSIGNMKIKAPLDLSKGQKVRNKMWTDRGYYLLGETSENPIGEKYIIVHHYHEDGNYTATLLTHIKTFDINYWENV
jgi:hypothetical protein